MPKAKPGQRRALPNLDKDDLLRAEVTDISTVAPGSVLLVLRLRPMFESQPRPVVVDVLRLRAAAGSAAV